jgi:5'-nucleotidase
MVERFRANPIAQPLLLNVNVPDVPFDELAGIAITRLGKRHKAQAAAPSRDPRGNVVYWVGAAGNAQDAGEGTDFHAVAQNRVSVTPLQMDLTHFAQLDSVRAWLE